MSYTKIIKSGSQVEIYEYEKAPDTRKAIKKNKRRSWKRLRYNRNIQRSRTSFFRMVLANLGRDRNASFLTLTMRDIVSIGEGYRKFTLFIQRLKRLSVAPFSCIAVPEFQERGAVHFHALIWGLSDETIQKEEFNRRIAKLWSWGFVDVVKVYGEPEKIAGYLTKYMFKAMYDDRLVGKKSYTASRTALRPVSLTSSEAVAYIKQEISGATFSDLGDVIEGVDKVPLVSLEQKVYATKWLGKCRYYKYNYEKPHGNDSSVGVQNGNV